MRSQIDFSKSPTVTKTHHKAECDINNILAGYEKTGIINHVKQGGQYVDAPSEVDYQTSLNLIMEAQNSFDDLPSVTRREFDNDPAKFLAFVQDPENVTRMGELGLLRDPPESDPGSLDNPQETATIASENKNDSTAT